MPYTPQTLAEKGERIYNQKYRSDYEARHLGKFVAIDVDSELAFVGNTPEAALQSGREKNPQGAFHLVKVGSPGVFRVGYAGRQSGDWIFQ